MAGRGPAPKPDGERRRTNKPTHDWKHAPGVGWQHGEVPKPPTRLTKAAQEAWRSWMGAWFAAFWTPDDVPALRQLVRLYDQVERGEFQRHAELRLAMEAFGLTPKGQMALRWLPAEPEADAEVRQIGDGRYGHLRTVAGDG